MTTGANNDSFFKQVEQTLWDVLHPDGADGNGDSEPGRVLFEAARRLCLAPAAKRARPRLVAMFGDAVSASPAALVGVAVAGELIHSASLLHDDVIDKATMRRGLSSANAHWGNVVAVLSGDFVLTVALDLLREHPRAVTFDAIDTMGSMTRAAIAEIEANGRLDWALDDWRAMAAGKTGALFAWCGRGAAHLGNEADAVERFARCGRHLGVAFQLTDDLLDLVGIGMGKDRFADIKNREPSFPLLVAAATAPAVRERLRILWEAKVITRAEAQAVGETVLETEAPVVTMRHIREEIDAAIIALGPFADRPGGMEIVAWARWLAQRVQRAETQPVRPI